jgi:hypothetical protein
MKITTIGGGVLGAATADGGVACAIAAKPSAPTAAQTIERFTLFLRAEETDRGDRLIVAGELTRR